MRGTETLRPGRWGKNANITEGVSQTKTQLSGQAGGRPLAGSSGHCEYITMEGHRMRPLEPSPRKIASMGQGRGGETSVKRSR